jgi:2-keto-4-pentenoate hydratase/2-oxohepta-3-ene-1,7-dioic acid hydratase in catechol pathway
MRLCTFVLPGERPDQQRAGVVRGPIVHELEGWPRTLSVIEMGPLESPTMGDRSYGIEEVVLMAPLPRPGKILATIVNTQGMLGGTDVRLDRPRVDMKAPSTVIGPEEVVRAPSSGIRPEVELAAVIGKKVTGANEDAAGDSIFGYTVLNDITAPADSRDDAYEAYRRDKASGVIRKSTMRGPLFRSKNHDTFCPMGPWIVTRDEVDWRSLKMTTRFDGRLIQDGSTSEYLFSPAKIVSYLSGFLTLEPGDVVSCGSVGWTKDAIGGLDPTEFILQSKEGTLELEIEGIGKLSNPVSFGRKDSITEPL